MCSGRENSDDSVNVLWNERDSSIINKNANWPHTHELEWNVGGIEDSYNSIEVDDLTIVTIVSPERIIRKEINDTVGDKSSWTLFLVGLKIVTEVDDSYHGVSRKNHQVRNK